MAGDTLAYVANYHPLVGHLIQQTGMVPILTAMLDDPNQEYGVDAGTVVAGLIHNILSSERIRLYRLSSFWHNPCSFPGVRRYLQRQSTKTGRDGCWIPYIECHPDYCPANRGHLALPPSTSAV